MTNISVNRLIHVINIKILFRFKKIFQQFVLFRVIACALLMFFL